MQRIHLLLLVLLSGCTTEPTPNRVADKPDVSGVRDTISTARPSVEKAKEPVPPPARVYANKRFKGVVVERIGEHKFRIQGQGQIYEASFGWVVEDGHYELKKGFGMTDAGAPAWGRFDFTVEVSKKRPNSTLHLILFESSAEDGSRQHELPLLLY